MISSIFFLFISILYLLFKLGYINKPVVMPYSAAWFYILFGLVFLSAIWINLFNKQHHLVFNKETNMLHPTEPRIFIKLKGFLPTIKIDRVMLDQIRAVRIFKSKLRFKSIFEPSLNREVYEIHCVMSDKYGCDYIISQHKDKDDAFTLASEISRFLNVELVEEY